MCDKCDQNLFRIGEHWFILHATVTCIEKVIKTETTDDSDPLDSCHDTNNSNSNTDAANVEFLKCNERNNDDVGDVEPMHDINESSSCSDINNANRVLDDAEKFNGENTQSKCETTNNFLVKKEIEDEINVENNENCSTSDQPYPLEIHPAQIDNENKRFECDECGKRYATNFELYKHHKDRLFCDRCQKRICLMKTHKETCDLMVFGCSICEKIFGSRILLQFHMKDCNLNKSRTFGVDNKTNKMRIQIEKVKNDDPNRNASIRLPNKNLRIRPTPHIICTICSKIFTTRSVYELHIQTNHPNVLSSESKKFDCGKCKDKFATHFLLISHMKRCKCGKIFCGNRELSFHKKYCFSYRFSCKFCNGTYGSKHLLNAHTRRMHSAELTNSNKQNNSNTHTADTTEPQISNNSANSN